MTKPGKINTDKITDSDLEQEKRSFLRAVIRYKSNGQEPDEAMFKPYQTIIDYLAKKEVILVACATAAANGFKTAWEKNCNAEIRSREEQNVRKYIKRYIGCPVEFNDDPRGIQIRLHLKVPETDYFFNIMDGETSGPVWIYGGDEDV